MRFRILGSGSTGNTTLVEDGALNVPAGTGVLANDVDAEGDVLTVRLIGGAAHGTLQVNPDGSFSYVPEPEFFGDDQFAYQASDGTGRSSPAATTPTHAPEPPADTNSTVPEPTGPATLQQTIPEPMSATPNDRPTPVEPRSQSARPASSRRQVTTTVSPSAANVWRTRP